MKKLFLLLFILPLVGLVYFGANSEAPEVEEGSELESLSISRKIKKEEPVVQKVQKKESATKRLINRPSPKKSKKVKKEIVAIPSTKEMMDKKQMDWHDLKENYLKKQLNLGDEEIKEISQLAGEASALEESIIKGQEGEDNLNDTAFEKSFDRLMENRIEYENQVAELMGEENWNKYLEFYRDYWGYSEDLALNKLYQPLK